jgi:PAS domain S-box-containing protein
MNNDEPTCCAHRVFVVAVPEEVQAILARTETACSVHTAAAGLPETIPEGNVSSLLCENSLTTAAALPEPLSPQLHWDEAFPEYSHDYRRHACHLPLDQSESEFSGQGCNSDLPQQTDEKDLKWLQLAFWSAGDSLWDWNLETDTIHYSHQWTEMLGYTVDEIAPHASDWRQLLHPDDEARVALLINEIREGKSPREIEMRLRHKDGHYVNILSCAFPVQRGNDGPPVRIVGASVDITERKRAGNELKALSEILDQRAARRTRALRTLHDIAAMANRVQDPEQAIQYTLQHVTTYHSLRFAHAFRPTTDNRNELAVASLYYDNHEGRFDRFRKTMESIRLQRGEGMAGRVFASGLPEWTTDLRSDLAAQRAALAVELGLKTAIALPVLVRDEVAAVLEFFTDRLVPRSASLLAAMTDVGIQLGHVIERAQFQEHLLAIADEVQRRIAQDLHDDVGQELMGLALKAETLAELLASAETPIEQLAADIALAAERTRRKIRTVSRQMLPLEADAGLLAEAIEHLAADTAAASHITCTFHCSHRDAVFDSRRSVQLYRIAQEAVANAVRHSRATNIRIDLTRENGKPVLKIEDNGMGMPLETAHKEGMGLRIMRYRAELIDADFEISPSRKGGTQVVCRLSP